MKRTILTTLCGALLLAPGCQGTEDPRPEPPAEEAAEEAAGAEEDLDPDPVPVCLRGEPFVAEGWIPLDGDGPADADAVELLRWSSHDGCERFVIDLRGEGGSPAASAGRVRAQLIRDLGVVRISLRDVGRVDEDATEVRLDGELARAAYAVWSREGRWVDVDLHLGSAAEARAVVLDDPARVVVDLRPGGGQLPEAPATHPRVVVLRPRPGEAAYPLRVTGYARTFEANVIARLERDGETVAEDFTTATAWTDAWGFYTITFDDGPSGPVTLHVGEHSARDGSWEGVAVELEMR